MFASFLAVLAIVGAYILARGGLAARVCITAYIAGVVATNIANIWLQSDSHLIFALAIVDSTLLTSFLAVTCLSDRGWCMWISALQLNTVVAEWWSIDLAGTDWPMAYMLVSIWGLPIFLLIGVGVWRDNRAGVTGNGYRRKASGA